VNPLTRMELILHRWNTRGIGHTHTMIHGLNKKTILLAATHHMGQEIARKVEGGVFNVVTLDRMQGLQGTRSPIVVDHQALAFMIQELIDFMRKDKLAVMERFGDMEQEITRLANLAQKREEYILKLMEEKEKGGEEE